MLSAPLHPLIVHFPIALLIFGVIAQFIALWKKDFFEKIALYLMASGFVTGILSYITGDGAESFAVKQKGDIIRSLVHTHETYAMVTMIIFGIVLAIKILHLLKWTPKLTPIVLVLCVAGVITLGFTGHYGGKMVYEVNDNSAPDTNH
jgi:uncharacterized membrane protein